MRDTAQEALREMRLLIFQLRPPALEKSGLAAALQARLDAVETRGGIRAKLLVEGTFNAEQLPLPIQEELYHIAQEALNNALKHAHPQQVRVGLRFSQDAICLEISDDGLGFALASAQESGGLGLRGMRERAERIGAELDIESAPGRGTKVTVQVPYSPKTEEAR
jgi:signal transduction histidine kinase